MRARILALLLLLGGASQSYAVCGYSDLFQSGDYGYACAEKTDDGLLECFDDVGVAAAPTPPAYAVDGLAVDGAILVWIKASDDNLFYSEVNAYASDSPCHTYGLCDGGVNVGDWCIDGPDCPGANCDVGAAGGLCNSGSSPDVRTACTTNADCPRYWIEDWPTGMAFIDIASTTAAYALCGIKTDNSLFCWGEGVEDWGVGRCSMNATDGLYEEGTSCTANADCVDQMGDTGVCYTGTAAPAGNFNSIDGNYDTFCGIKTDGSLSCWGDTRPYGATAATVVTSPPAGTTYTKVEVSGDDGACALRTNGTIVCWGDYAPLLASPSGTFSDLGVGLDFGCAITADYAVQCWGDDYAWHPTTCGWTSLDGNESSMCYRTPEGYLECSYPYLAPTPSSCPDITTACSVPPEPPAVLAGYVVTFVGS